MSEILIFFMCIKFLKFVIDNIIMLSIIKNKHRILIDIHYIAQLCISDIRMLAVI